MVTAQAPFYVWSGRIPQAKYTTLEANRTPHQTIEKKKTEIGVLYSCTYQIVYEYQLTAKQAPREPNRNGKLNEENR